MKTIFLILLLTVLSIPVHSQNITNTLGASGTFTIKDASNSYLTLTQSNGLLSLSKNLNLLNTTSSSLGIITKGGNRFIHNFAPAGVPGNNTFIGMNSGNLSMSGTGSFSSYNTALGGNSLQSLTTGYTNTALGFQTLFYNTTGYSNSAVGGSALYYNTSGYSNTAMGTSSLGLNTSGHDNTAVGLSSLYGNTTGNYNTAAGTASLFSNSTGFANTAMGYLSLYQNTTGANNTTIGYQSLYSNTTGLNNIALGNQSLYSNTTGGSNAALGGVSLLSNTTGSNNTAVGILALYSNTVGNGNTAVGFRAGVDVTGSYNTFIGYNTQPPPVVGSQIMTGSNNAVIGSDAAPSSLTVSNEITLGNSSVTSLRCRVGSITSLSDARDKKNIQDLSLGIDFVMKLKPRLFYWDKREWYHGSNPDGSKMEKTPTAGFIAQEFDDAQTKENVEWLNLVMKNNPEKLEATPGNLLPVMVKALQDLKTENNELKNKLETFERVQTVLAAEIAKLKSKETEFKQVKNEN